MSLYVESDRKVWQGEEARKRLAQNNDLRWLQEKRGVLRVDKERWLKAQEFEQKTWLVDGRWTREDNNTWHKIAFNNYQALRGLTFEKGIELGCGPFTNIRYVAQAAKIDNIWLLDPLIKQYLKHRFCRYKDGRMWVREQVMQTPVYWPWHKKVQIIDSAIEDFDTKVKFDLILLINVLEHCQNVEVVWQKILSMAAPGAVLVMADKYYHGADLSENLKDRYDAGHPLKVDRSVIDEFLEKNWNSLYRNVVKKKGRVGSKSSDDHEAVYFIGRLKETKQ